MTFKQKVDKHYLKLAPADKIPLGGSIISGLNAHPTDYPALPYTAAVLATTNRTLNQAIQDAISGDHSKIDIRRIAEKDWNLKFSATGDYVSVVANGNAVLISQLGLAPTKSQSSPGSLPAIAVLMEQSATNQQGSAHLKVATEKEAAAFVTVLAEQGCNMIVNGAGTITVTTKSGDKVYIHCDTHEEVLLSGLQSGMKLTGIVQPVNHIGAGPEAVVTGITPQ